MTILGSGAVATLRPLFLDGPRSRLFGVYRRPAGAGQVLILPSFAEEMNNSRRAHALLSRLLAERGVGSLALDPTGCGDSYGELADQRWSGWVADAAFALRWLAQQGDGPIHLYGLRLGALHALAAAAEADLRGGRVVLCQPVLDGRDFLNRFLRVQLVAEGEGRVTPAQLRQRLDAGETIEVAGYELSSALARDLDALRFGDLIAACPAPVQIMELAPGTGLAATLAPGDPFWARPEAPLPTDLMGMAVRLLAGEE